MQNNIAKRPQGGGNSKRRRGKEKRQHHTYIRERTGSRLRGQVSKQREEQRPRGGIKQQSRAVGQTERTSKHREGNRRRGE